MNTTNAAAALASVVFLKIQEFARRTVQEQTRLRAQLEAVVAVTAAELSLENRVVLDAADGTAIVVLGDPGGCLRLAERAIAATAAGLPLCIGVNHGAVQMAPDGRGDDGMIGDGIAVAANIAEFASPSRVMISRSFRNALAYAQPGAEASLYPAGVHTDAGLRRYELFTPDRAAAGRRKRRRAALGAAAAVVLLGAGIAARVTAGGRVKSLDETLGTLRNAAKRGEELLRGLRARFKR